MNESQKKLAVVVVGIAVFGTIVVWRSAKALREVRAAQGEDAEAGETIVTNVEAHAPSDFHPSGIPAFMEEPPLPKFELGTIKVRASEQHIRASFNVASFHQTEVKPARAMGANAVWHKQVDTDLPDLELGQAESTDVFYLLYVSKLPDEWRSRLGGTACFISQIIPGSAADQGGMQLGDVLLDVDHERAAGGALPACAVAEALKAKPRDQAVSVTVLRDGKPVELTLTKRGKLFGYFYNELPVLPAGTTQLPR